MMILNDLRNSPPVRVKGGAHSSIVLDVSADKRNDFDFFRKLQHEQNNGGREALLQALMDFDLSDFEVSFYINNKLQEKGNTKNVLENPLNAVLWLIITLCKKGEPMLKHQFISSGSCTKAYKLEIGNRIKADFGKLGTIEFDYI